jgi:murein DD-endopeptidase MepM/ murein hydrolase activator NlpD
LKKALKAITPIFAGLNKLSARAIRLAIKYLKLKVPALSKGRHYSHFFHEHRQTQTNLMPEKLILKRTAIASVTLLVLSSINPTGYFFGDSSFATQASSYLSQEDIEYNNLAQLIATDEGFLVKNMPVQEDSVIVERIDFVDHEVQRGETIASISQMYKLSTDTIIWENDIISVESVKPGDRLRIPPTDGISYEVKRGDTLSGLALKYESQIEQINKYNQTGSTGLRVGSKIFIPGGKRITTQLIASEPSNDQTPDTPVNKPTKVANIQTDINANIMPNNRGFETPPPSRPSTPDARPNPNIAPIQGITSNRSIVQDADPSIRAVNTTIESAQKEIPNTPAPVSTGDWGKPTIGNVTQGYRRGHFALDIANRNRPAIWATAAGTVETAGWGGAYGNYIIINHGNGFKTLYAHNSDLYVKAGDTVTKGQVIAQMGNTGRVYGATGIHLHYECHQDGVRINPYSCME